MRIEFELDGLENLAHGLLNGAKPFDEMLSQWAMRYREWAQVRFSNLSRGGGEWPALHPRTVQQKERKGSRTPDTILRDRSILFHALDPLYTERPGQYEEKTDFSVELGVGGDATYPPPSRMTVGEVANIHHMGRGRVPVRSILEEPPKNVIDEMAEDARRAVSRVYLE